MEKSQIQAAARYWYRDFRDDREYITNARNMRHLYEKAGTKRIQIERVWRRKNLNPNDQILYY